MGNAPVQKQADPFPAWFKENDACFLEYCNGYEDLKKAFCCPPNVARVKWSNGGMYCSEDHSCTSDQQAASCKNHGLHHGLREGRFKKSIFSNACKVLELPSGSNQAAPPGYKAKAGSGPCRCRGSGWNLDSCGKLCCKGSPYTDPDPSGKYYFKKHNANAVLEDSLCYEKE